MAEEHRDRRSTVGDGTEIHEPMPSTSPINSDVTIRNGKLSPELALDVFESSVYQLLVSGFDVYAENLTDSHELHLVIRGAEIDWSMNPPGIVLTLKNEDEE